MNKERTRDKNWRIVKDIKNEKLIYDLRDYIYKDNTNAITLLPYNNYHVLYFDIESLEEKIKYTNSIFYKSKDNRHKRFFCSCGHISEGVMKKNNITCSKCGNDNYIESISVNNSMYKDTPVIIDRFYFGALELDYDKNNQTYDIYVRMLREQVTKEYLEIVEDKHHLAHISKDSIVLKEDYNKFIVFLDVLFYNEKLIKLIQNTPLEKPFKEFIMNNKQKDLPQTNSLESIIVLLALSLNNIFINKNNDGYILHLLNFYNKETFNDRKDTIRGVFNSCLKDKSLDGILSYHGILEYKPILKYMYANILIYIIEKELSLFDNLKNKMYLNEIFDIIKLTDPNYYKKYIFQGIESTLDNIISIYNNSNMVELFQLFVSKNKYAYPDLSFEFLTRYYFLKSLNLHNEEYFYTSEVYYTVLNKYYLREEKFPEEKITAFDTLINIDPLKAYSLMSSKRKLNNDEKEVLRDVLQGGDN